MRAKLRRSGLLLPYFRRGDALSTLAAAKWRKEYAVSTRGANCCARSTFPLTGKEVVTDTPRSSGGLDAGAQPVEHLLAALVGCEQATAHFVARKLWPPHIKLERIDFELTAWRDERGALQMPISCIPEHPSRVQQVSGTAVVHALGCTPQDVRQLAEQVEQRCPVANLFLAAGTRMDIEWVPATEQHEEERRETNVKI